MIDLNTEWLRIFDFGASALVFGSFTIVCFYLGTRKFIGHRGLLLHTSLFSLIRSISNIFLMSAEYRHNHGSMGVSVLLTISVIVGVSLAARLLVSVENLFTTLVRTESADMVRKDALADKQTENLLFQYMADQSKQRSIELLSSATARLSK